LWIWLQRGNLEVGKLRSWHLQLSCYEITLWLQRSWAFYMEIEIIHL
jgi:hypothetical protein